MHTRSTTRHLQTAGYSLVEVMMALAVLTAGSLGVMSLQRASLHSNFEARQLSTATTIARLWAERLKRDARVWNEPATSPSELPLRVQRTSYLQHLVGDLQPETVETLSGGWQSPLGPTALPFAGINQGESAAFDHYGNEVAPDSDAVRFCAQVRLQSITAGHTMRAELRVYWARLGEGTVRCNIDHDGIESPDSGFRVLRTSTVLRWTPP